MQKRLFLLPLLFFLLHLDTFAQIEITGKAVSGDDGSPLIGGIVMLKSDSTIGTVTDYDGNYKISVPDDKNGVLIFKYLGYKTLEMRIGSRTVVDVVLTPDVSQLDEVVVTGVAEGTSTKKLGFAIGKVNKETIEQVPATDAGAALRGKVAGVTIVQSSGVPGSESIVRMRGSTSIQGNEQPLVIVDGQITQGGLSDINMQDVASVEVIKGAAAASLYGSLAGNGVIQIITRRGSQTANKTSVTVRNEVGFSNLQKRLPLATHHYFELNPDGSFATKDSIFPNSNDPTKYDTISNRIPQTNYVLDQPFQREYDQQKLLFANRLFFTNYVQVGSTGDKTTILTSFENTHTEGVVVGFQAFERKNVRLNIDHKLTEKLKLSVSSLYSGTSAPQATQRTQGGVIFGALNIDPDLNLEENNPDGTPYRAFFKDRGTNANNPLYESTNLVYKSNSDRFLATMLAEYRIAKWWRLEGQYSYDNNNATSEFYKKKGYLDVTYPTGGPGSLSKATSNSNYRVATFGSYFNRQFGLLKASLALKYQFEKNTGNSLSASGSNFTVTGVPQFQAMNNQSVFATSGIYEINTENMFSVLNLEYKSRYIFEGVIRRDASSLFGPETRTKYFYRLSGVYRLTEDIKIKNIQDIKLRASYGTSGNRPPSFSAQYDIYELTNGNSIPVQLANPRLRPSVVKELEYGTNIYFLNNFTFEFNHAIGTVHDNILYAPIPAYTGNQRQWQNNSILKSRTFEMALDADILKKEKLSWKMGFTGSQTKQMIVRLDIPQYSTSGDPGRDQGANKQIAPYRIQEGVSMGAMYGNVFAHSNSDLQVDENGYVTNVDRTQIGTILKDMGLEQDAPLTLNNFEVNDLGYLILKNPTSGASLQYTANERAIRLADPSTGRPVVQQIGDALPKFITGIRSTITYKNFSLYFLFDSQWGGNIYNYTKQLLYFNLRSADLDQADRPVGQRHSANFYTGSLYSGGNPSSHFVEKGTFTTFREFNLSYNISKEVLGKLWKLNTIFYEGRVSLIGRNLITFSRYSGYSPEVASGNNTALYRTDNFSYPIFRTYSVAVQFKF